MIMKADGERSLKHSETPWFAIMVGIIVPEVSARGESQSNGVAEQAAQVVAEFVRVLKEQIEGEDTNEVIARRYHLVVDGTGRPSFVRSMWLERTTVPFGERVFSNRFGKAKIAGTSSRAKTGKVCGWATIGRRMKFSSERREGLFEFSLTDAEVRAPDGTYINSKQVYRKVFRVDAKRRGIPILRTRWVDIDKGDDHEHKCRSRFVAMEFNTQKVNGLYASTPPLKLLISDVATRTSDTFKEEEEEKVIMVNDVARACFEAQVERSIAIESPDEDKTEGQDMVGFLEKSLYGTRDAALNFPKEVRKFMQSQGFVVGKYNSSTYLHKAKGIKVMVHGDDFVSSGSRSSLKWFKSQLEKTF